MSLTWDLNGANIYSGGMDKFIKVWDQNLNYVREASYLDSIHSLKFINENCLAVSGSSFSKTVTVWRPPKFECPLFTFKGNNKEPFIKFDADTENKYMIALSRDKDAMPEVLPFEQAKEHFRCNQSAFAVDQNDNIAFTIKSLSNILAIHNFSDDKEYYENETIEDAEKILAESKVPIQSREVVDDISVKSVAMYQTFDERKPSTSLKLMARRSYTNGMTSNDKDIIKFEDCSKIKEEIQFYEQRYEKKSDNIPECLTSNAELAKTNGLFQISKFWLFLKNIYMDYISDQNQFKNMKYALPDGANSLSNDKIVRNFIQYISEQEVDQMTSINSNSLIIKEGKILINKQLETKLKLRNLNEEGAFNTNKRALFSKIASDIIIDLINNGEIIHGYSMYSVLKDFLDLPEKVTLTWECCYIDMLLDQHLHVLAAKLIKNSTHSFIKEKSWSNTTFNFMCPKCSTEITAADKSICPKCKRGIKCGICKKSVKGLMLICSECGHGGHLEEMMKWFDRSKEDVICPEGCDHRCFDFSEEPAI